MKKNTYDQYRLKVIEAKDMGFTDADIKSELLQEMVNIRHLLANKLRQLAGSRTPYAGREASRLAAESCTAIDRIITELEKKNEKVSA